jgi:hypothetical protein
VRRSSDIGTLYVLTNRDRSLAKVGMTRWGSPAMPMRKLTGSIFMAAIGGLVLFLSPPAYGRGQWDLVAGGGCALARHMTPGILFGQISGDPAVSFSYEFTLNKPGQFIVRFNGQDWQLPEQLSVPIIVGVEGSSWSVRTTAQSDYAHWLRFDMSQADFENLLAEMAAGGDALVISTIDPPGSPWHPPLLRVPLDGAGEPIRLMRHCLRETLK